MPDAPKPGVPSLQEVQQRLHGIAKMLRRLRFFRSGHATDSRGTGGGVERGVEGRERAARRGGPARRQHRGGWPNRCTINTTAAFWARPRIGWRGR